MLTKERLEYIRKKAEEATPGPWFMDGEGNIFAEEEYSSYGRPVVYGRVVEGENFPKTEDAAFIAAASPDFVIDILDRLDALEQRNTEDEEQLS